MAQHRGKQGEWPLVKREPDAWVVVPDVWERTDRGVASLRSGTAPDGVGLRGRSAPGAGSDYGTDRVSPREFDPLGTSVQRYSNSKRDAELISSNPAPRSNSRGSGAGHD